MTVIELLDGLIEDLTDCIQDYKYDIKMTDSRIERRDLDIKIGELMRWRETLRIIRLEQG